MKPTERAKIWDSVTSEWQRRGDSRFTPGNTGAAHLPLNPSGAIHYEWHIHPATNSLDVALDFEVPHDRAENLRRAQLIHERRDEIERGIGYPFCCGFFGDESGRARFIMPLQQFSSEEELARAAV